MTFLLLYCSPKSLVTVITVVHTQLSENKYPKFYVIISTNRQEDIFLLALTGKSNMELASSLYISEPSKQFFQVRGWPIDNETE